MFQRFNTDQQDPGASGSAAMTTAMRRGGLVVVVGAIVAALVMWGMGPGGSADDRTAPSPAPATSGEPAPDGTPSDKAPTEGSPSEDAPSEGTPSDEVEPPSTFQEPAPPVEEGEGNAVSRDIPVPAAEPAPKAADEATSEESSVAELAETPTESFTMVGVTWAPTTDEASVGAEVRVKRDDGWSDWAELEVDDASDETSGARDGTEPWWVERADEVQARVTTVGGAPAEDVRVVTVDPGEDPQDTSADASPAFYSTTDSAPAVQAAAVSRPAIIMRAGWGAAAQRGCGSPKYGTKTQGVVLHHTAGSNSYTKAQSAGIVRAAQSYHVNGRGWCDIGYNFLVDKYGQIFEGRAGGIDRPVRAAHAGNFDVNAQTMGVSMMGNYDTAQLTTALKDSVVKLVAWRLGASKVAAKGKVSIGGKSLNIIAGHRDVLATACPGRYGYAWLSAKDGLRDRVEDTLAGSSGGGDTSPPPVVTGLKAVPTSNSATLSWNASTGARSYDVCLFEAGTATSCARTVTGITSTSTVVKDLTPTSGTDHYFRVRAVGADGKKSTYSAGMQPFDLKPAQVSGLKVSTTESTANLSWGAAAGAESYDVCLFTYAAATSCWKTTSGVKGTSVTLEDLVPTSGTDYFFRVRAANGSGATSTYSAGMTGFNLRAASASADVLTIPSSKSFTLTGHGYGHGIGMSQHGAQGAALKGKTYNTILWYYYRGTQFATKTGSIRVLISKATSSTVQVKGRSGMTFRRPGTSVSISLPTSVSGRSVTGWRIAPQSGAATASVLQYTTGSSWVKYGSGWVGDAEFAASTVTLSVPGGTAVYRGAVRSAIPSKGSTARDVVNVVSVEDYVRGVVSAEMPSSWRPEALKAQAVAARTYGVRGLTPSRYYDICDTTSCQVYRGVSGETANTDAAVAGTKGQILTYEGKPAFTQFSSSSGGWTAVGSQPYLVARDDDAWDDHPGNTVHDWKATVSASTLERKYPAIGTLKSIRVTKREGGGDWGGRVSTVSLVGSSSTTTISGATMRFDLGLRSAWFRLN